MITYKNLLKSGWTLNEIDKMDFLGYIRVIAYSAKPKEAFIDDFLQ